MAANPNLLTDRDALYMRLMYESMGPGGVYFFLSRRDKLMEAGTSPRDASEDAYNHMCDVYDAQMVVAGDSTLGKLKSTLTNMIDAPPAEIFKRLGIARKHGDATTLEEAGIVEPGGGVWIRMDIGVVAKPELAVSKLTAKGRASLHV